jgi:para-nitrobenzyl esterase
MHDQHSNNPIMKKFLSILSATFLSITISAQCEEGRYREFIFSDYTVNSDVAYGENINLDGENESLLMDVYTPAGDAAADRALVILCHGGYFIGGDKAATDMVPLCEDLAKMGYVVASINYRLGIPFAFNLEVPYGQAVVRAVQDLRAAIRWFRKSAEEENNPYGIDPENIYAGGSSAGGFMSLHLAYMDENEIPEWLDMSIPGLEGGLEGESGNAGYASDVKAIISVSGALGDANWVDAEDTTPACLFHGDEDNVITIDSGLFVLFNTIDVTTVEGSNYINERLDQFGIEHCYEINEGEGHVAYVDNAAIYDTTLSIISNFLSAMICDIALDCSYRELATSVEENQPISSMLYPNPAKDICYIQDPKKQFNRVVFHDLQGRYAGESALTENYINIGQLSPGVYIVELIGPEQKGFSKLIVE